MWNKNKSLILSIALTTTLLAVLTFMVFAMPWLLQLYIDLLNRIYTPKSEILTVFYCCVPFAYVVFGVLLKLLLNISSGNVFTLKNVNLLRVLSWSCLAIALICLVGGYWYLPFLIVCPAVFFIAVIIRVITSVLAYGTELKDDNDLTI